MSIRFLVAVVLLFAPGVARADDGPPPPPRHLEPDVSRTHTVPMSCRTYLDGQPGNAIYFTSWAFGYMAGLNFSRLLGGQDERDIWVIHAPDIDHLTTVYCEQHPQDGYEFAIINLYRNLPLMPGTAEAFKHRPGS